jgi:phosphonoacetaldehyde hydrolase
MEAKTMIQGVVLDWAGTTIDYGSTGPAQAFVGAFAEDGIEATLAEARGPMGLPTRDHVREMFKVERILAQFQQRYGRRPDEFDVSRIYERSEREMMRTLGDYCTPLPGVLETVQWLRERGIRIGSSTGYTRKMMDEVVMPRARQYGYTPDAVVTPDDAPAGRPAPLMCYVNAVRLSLWPLWQCVKVGDTLADIAEGRNAGMWSIGVLRGSSLVGLSPREEADLPVVEVQARLQRARESYLLGGADMVLDQIGDLPNALERVGERLAAGDRPASPLRAEENG